VSNPAGLALGQFNADPAPDLAVQTPDGFLLGTGDGAGRFVNLRFLSAGTPGALAAPAGARVDPTVALLPGDLFADLITVAPGSDEVLVFKGDGQGNFLPAERYASGGHQPVSVVAGNFVGDAALDLAVGHRDGTVAFLRGNPDGTFTPLP